MNIDKKFINVWFEESHIHASCHLVFENMMFRKIKIALNIWNWNHWQKVGVNLIRTSSVMHKHTYVYFSFSFVCGVWQELFSCDNYHFCQ